MSLAAPLPVFLRSTQPVRGRAVSGTGTDAGVSSATPDARITVVRQSENDVGFREIFVSLDGQSIGILRHGETLTTDVPSGPHRIRAHNTLFWKTHDIVLKPGEHARFVAINKAGWGTFGMLFVLGAMPVYLSFERVPAQVFSNSADR